MMALVLFVVGMNAQANSNPSLYETSQEAYASAQELSSKDLSCVSAVDCMVLPAGRRPCGGAEKAVIASANNADLEIVKRMIRVGNQVQAQDDTPRYGICDYRPLPSAICDKGVCAVEMDYE